MQPNSQTRIAGSLVGLALGLLLVGLVSHTPIRHLIQVLPALMALIGRQISWARFAAMPIFLLWFCIMLAIWLFLLGVARVITGRFAPMEILLTVVIGLSCVVGLIASARASRPVSRTRAIVAFLGFAALQIGAVWLSQQPTFAHS